MMCCNRLVAALNLIYPTIPHQRCSFHKLRNLWHSIQTLHAMTSHQRQTFKLSLIHKVQAIFYASNDIQARSLYDEMSMHYGETQANFATRLAGYHCLFQGSQTISQLAS